MDVGDVVDIGVYAVSADGNNQSVGFVGVVIHWNADALGAISFVDNGPFDWPSSGFLGDPAGLNSDLDDGDAFYIGTLLNEFQDAAVATAAGLLVTTLRFNAQSAMTGTSSVSVVACDGTSCTTVLDRFRFAPGVLDITGSLGPPVQVSIECQNNAHCDDGNPCTDDSCDIENLCANVPNDANDPDDFLYCNGHEIECDGGAIIIEPGSVPDCDDGLACTIDACNEALDTCDNTVAGDKCLIAGVCRNSGELNPSNDCQACNPVNNQSAWSNRTVGSSCGNTQEFECNHADSCNGLGVCLSNIEPPGAACGDSSNTTCTDPDTCDGAGACLTNHAANGTSCDDGLFCTPTDSCQTGVCLGSGDQCPSQVCDEFDNNCVAVNLEWRNVQPNPVQVGGEVQIQLYAVSDTGSTQPFASMSAVLTWDPTRLKLLGKIDNGPYSWLQSSFPNDSLLDGLNAPYTGLPANDGDAWYQALGQFGTPPQATTGGLRVTTFRFEALAVLPAQVTISANFGGDSKTEVLDMSPPGLVITGDVGGPANIQIVQCLNNTHCNDGEFCNGVETCSSNACVPGSPPSCDDGLFCNGDEICVFGGTGCQSQGNPCPLPATCDELLNECSGCKAPTVVVEGSRYLAITPAAGVNPVALRVTGLLADGATSCVEQYVLPGGALSEFPVYLTPAEWGTAHVSGCSLKPLTAYDVQTDCQNVQPGHLSNRVRRTTWKWGDINGNGVVNIVDFLGVSDAAGGTFTGGLTVPNVDLAPCAPDGVIDAQDVAASQAALSGGAYPCPSPCTGGEPNGSCALSIPAVSSWGLICLSLLLFVGGTVRLRRRDGAALPG